MELLSQEKLKERVGDALYDRLISEAEKEVALALQMPLLDQWRKEKYYHQRFLLSELLPEMETFEKLGLKISPMDIINIFFKAKLLFAANAENEYIQRSSGNYFFEEPPFSFRWQERSGNIHDVIDEHLRRLAESIVERTLITEISHFVYQPIYDQNYTPGGFFEKLFSKLGVPFSFFFEDEKLIEKHKILEPHLREYNLPMAKGFFNSPSIGFTVVGSYIYAYWYATTWLRAFLNMLRIASFIYRPQIDFGMGEASVMAPTGSTFLGTHSSGAFSWDEDTKRPWEKTADGCLFISFGYRGISKIYLDERVTGGLEKFFFDNKAVFDHLKNPWSRKSLGDIASSLDILSSATQIPDIGAKILLLYCCLEHLFVPKNINVDNKKYVVGGIHALRPDLLPWFNRLYQLRCDYAHKGFVRRTDEARGLIFESMQNAFSLLVAKLSIEN